MKPTLMIVDDVAEMRARYREALEGDFDIVAEAENGLEATQEYLRLYPAYILMDVVMPKMSGIDAAREIMKAGRKPQIIFISGMRGEDIVLAAFDAGACDYLIKPVDAVKLKELLLSYVKSTAA